MRPGLVLGTVLAIGVVMIAAARPLPPAPVNHYIDSATCAGCHHQIYESYRQTSMGRSLYAPAPSNTVEDYQQSNTYYHALSDTQYAMTAHDGSYFQRRWQKGFDGKDTNLEETKIDYVIGAGDHARSYLHLMASGSMMELPLGWYAERGGYWAMSPGFDSRHPQTRRLVSYECMFCHNGYPQNPTRAQVESPEPVFSRVPEGIDCQRCHGPGEQHERVVQKPGVKPEEIRASIVNPARLSPKLQMETCMQCHLEPTSGRLPSIMRRFQREPFSYIPGQPLQDFLLYFDHAPGTGHDDKFEIAGAAYRLRKSRCFSESKGALTCLTCHDPHQSLPVGETGDRYFSQKCLGCHRAELSRKVAAAQHPKQQNCINCHMPKRRTEDVVHAVITDHSIQRQRPGADLLAEIPERHPTEAEDYHGEVVPYYPSPLIDTGESQLYRAVAQVALENNLKRGLAELQREIIEQKPHETEFYAALGEAYRNNGDARHAVTAYEQAVAHAPASVASLASLASAYKANGEPARSKETLERALRLAPADASVLLQYGQLEVSLGQMDSALEKIRKATKLNPDLPGGYASLASLELQAGHPESAEAAVRSALAVNPYDAAAYNTAGRVLAGRQQPAEALFDFAKAAALRPEHGPYQYDYALMLVRMQRLTEAELPAGEAVKADPEFAPGHDLLGTLFAQKSQLGDAAKEYQRAVELDPDFSRAQLDLGLVLAAQGDLAGARLHFNKAAQGRDAGVAQRASQALTRLGPR